MAIKVNKQFHGITINDAYIRIDRDTAEPLTK